MFSSFSQFGVVTGNLPSCFSADTERIIHFSWHEFFKLLSQLPKLIKFPLAGSWPEAVIKSFENPTSC